MLSPILMQWNINDFDLYIGFGDGLLPCGTQPLPGPMSNYSLYNSEKYFFITISKEMLL